MDPDAQNPVVRDAQKLVRALILPIIPACYANEYPPEKLKEDGKHLYPYVTIAFSNAARNNEFSDLYTLQIDIWDNQGSDVTQLEQLTDVVFHVLNKQHFLTDTLFMELYRDTLPDPDDAVRRRQLKFVARIYERTRIV